VRILLDTNIVIHREAPAAIDEDIGVLFRWIDNLHYAKYIHTVTAEELKKHEDQKVRKSFEAKLASYNILKTVAPRADEVRRISAKLDKNERDRNDTLIINELYSGRVDALITEDKGLILKASLLGIPDLVYTIDAFLEKVTTENPALTDYKVLSVRKEYLGDLDISDEFFTSFKKDYPDYARWFNKKANEEVYVCLSGRKPLALLYLKVEGKDEDYSDIEPPLPSKRRLKIGSFKVALNGFRLGERLLKIAFDNALRFKVEEIYVTTFNKRIEQQRLINLFEEYGFSPDGHKMGPGGKELVYVRSFARETERQRPKFTYPFFSTAGHIFIVPIYPEYHTELFPDSILRTESPMDFVENEPHRNAISKVYISRSIERELESGDVIVFYRTAEKWPAYHSSVVTTIGVVESIFDHIPGEEDFIRLCRKRSVFTDKELSKQWNFNRTNRPFIVNFLYVYSLPKRITRQELIEMGVIFEVHKGPRGFTQITADNLTNILRAGQADESIAVD
jgi:predicted nucleic acid-binding protein